MKYVVGNDFDRRRLAKLQRIEAAGDRWFTYLPWVVAVSVVLPELLGLL